MLHENRHNIKEKNMEQKQFDEMMENWLKRREQVAGSKNADLEWAVSAGITDGSRPRAYVTREECVLMLTAALRYWIGCVFRILKGEMELC